MPKISKRIVDGAEPRERDYFIWDSELVGFAVRVLTSGRRTYVIQYRAKGRTRRFTIGSHGVWTPEAARREARILLGRIARGDNPAEEKHLDAEAITVKELCERYLADCEAGLVLGKKRRPKRPSTLKIDRSRINRHIVPLLGNRKVKDLTSTDIMQFLRDVAAGKTRADIKTGKHGRAIVRGGIGTAGRGVGLIGGIFTYAIREGIIERNPAHGIRKAADRVRDRRLSEAEYGLLGKIIAAKADDPQFATTVKMVRALALTGCRRGEIIELKGVEVEVDRSCLRLQESKEGASTRPVGLPVIELLEPLIPEERTGYVFPGTKEGKPLVGFPDLWIKLLRGTALADITPHVLRHSFASMANDLGFTETTIAALVGHSRGTITARYIHTIDTALVMAADTVAGYIAGLLDGVQFRNAPSALDRKARRATLDQLYAEAVVPAGPAAGRLAA
jgi:integrase